ncbi:uncharacterized protein [Haliotis cracherodii]
MVKRSSEMAHKQSGVGSRNPSHIPLAESTTINPTLHIHRQQHCGVVPAQSGNNTLQLATATDIQVFPFSGSAATTVHSSAHPRMSKHSGRCSITTRQGSTHRVETSHRSIPNIGSEVRATKHRPVCNLPKPSTFDICLPVTRSEGLGGGRIQHSLGRTKGVCISATSSTSQGNTKDPRDKNTCSDFGRALVASERVVRRAQEASRKRPTTPSTVVQPTYPPSQQIASSNTRQISSARLVRLKKALSAKGYSARAAKAITLAHRPSTRSLYDDKWVSFETFCKAKGQDPTTASPQFLAEYLLHLRTQRHLKGSTITTYLVALNSVLAVPDNRKITKIPELQALLRSFRLEDQKTKFRPPAWDLNVVLRGLRGPPFEPLNASSFYDLTKKTMFLLALATAARVSELHAIDITRVRFEHGTHGTVHLGLCWDFIAKNQLPGQPDRSFTIPPISTIVGSEDEGELLLCPVRALRIFIRRSKTRRGSRKRLFIPVSTTSTTEVSRNTISLWLRAVILQAYSIANLDPPRTNNPHEIRALASTMALHSNCTIKTIMEGCFWRSDTVFASHYLRDVTLEDIEGVRSFGPLVVAQQVTNPRRK